MRSLAREMIDGSEATLSQTGQSHVFSQHARCGVQFANAFDS